jgi:penicillin-binding protein 2
LKGNVPEVDYYDRFYGKKRWKASTIFSLGIGQGELGITPLQMANIMCIIANKGYYYTPHIVKKIGDKANTTRNLGEKHYTKVEPQYFDAIHDGMQLVVEAGTARIARFGNVVICGKTGTAQNPHGKDHSLFVAFAPRENPKIAIAVMVENSGFGATWAAPVASLMMEQYLTDSISRPELYERMIKGNLLPTRYDTLLKKTDRAEVPEIETIAVPKPANQ